MASKKPTKRVEQLARRLRASTNVTFRIPSHPDVEVHVGLDELLAAGNSIDELAAVVATWLHQVEKDLDRVMRTRVEKVPGPAPVVGSE